MTNEDAKARSDEKRVVDAFNRLINEVTGEPQSSNKYEHSVKNLVGLLLQACVSRNQAEDLNSPDIPL